MPNPIFLVTIDVDETLLNGQTETPKASDCDFNGSEEFNDPSAWMEFIQTLETLCENKGYELVVNLVSGKINGLVDDSIDACHRSPLVGYLHARSAMGKVSPISSRERYLVRRHLSMHTSSELFYNKLLACNHSKSDEGEQIFKDHIMPAVHICFENGLKKHTSKALVLEELRVFYNITPAQMIHIDNSNKVEADLLGGANGQTPSFNNLNCHTLKLLKYEDKSERTEVTKMLIAHFTAEINQQILQLPSLLNLGAAASPVSNLGAAASPTPNLGAASTPTPSSKNLFRATVLKAGVYFRNGFFETSEGSDEGSYVSTQTSRDTSDEDSDTGNKASVNTKLS